MPAMGTSYSVFHFIDCLPTYLQQIFPGQSTWASGSATYENQTWQSLSAYWLSAWIMSCRFVFEQRNLFERFVFIFISSMTKIVKEFVYICSEVLDMTHVIMKLLVKFVFKASIKKMIPWQKTAGCWTLYWSQPSRVDCDEKKRSLAPAVILAGDRLCLKMITTPPSPVTVQCPILAGLTEQPKPCPHFIE